MKRVIHFHSHHPAFLSPVSVHRRSSAEPPNHHSLSSVIPHKRAGQTEFRPFPLFQSNVQHGLRPTAHEACSPAAQQEWSGVWGGHMHKSAGEAVIGGYHSEGPISRWGASASPLREQDSFLEIMKR